MDGFDNIGRSVRSFTAAAPDADQETPKAASLGEAFGASTPAGDSAPETVAPEPAVEQFTGGEDVKQGGATVLRNACECPQFMLVDVADDDVAKLARDYNPTAQVVECIADRDMLLRYMVGLERKYNMTMSFPACGVDPHVFDLAVAEVRESNGGEDVPPVVAIPVAGRAADEEGKNETELYEKIIVDGVTYLSCASEYLNSDYLHKVLAEATEGLMVHDEYLYTMVGPRPLVVAGDTEQAGPYIETLKLNSYELSVFVSYMQKIPGVTVKYGTYDNRSAIMFKR